MKIKKLTSFFEKLQGLSFIDVLQPVYFETRWGIHTCFVKKPIDVIICDDNFIVRKIVRCMKPWRVLVWDPLYKNVFELPENFKIYSKIKIGDKIKI